MVILTFGSQPTSSDHSQCRCPSSLPSAARMLTTRSTSGNSNRWGTSASRSFGPMSGSSLIVVKIQSMIVRNSFDDENSAPMAQEDEPDERVDEERERVVVERLRDAAGFFAVVERFAAGFFAAVERFAAGFLAAVERDAAGLRAAVLRDDDDEPRPGTSRAATRRASFSTSPRKLFKSSETLCDDSSLRIRPTALP